MTDYLSIDLKVDLPINVSDIEQCPINIPEHQDGRDWYQLG